MFTSALTRLSHTGQEFSENIFCEGVELYFEISLFEQNFINTVKPRFNGQMRTNDSPLLEKVR